MLSGTRSLETFQKFQTFRPRYVVDCNTVEDVCNAVVEAGSQGLRVRAIGSGYSWAPEIRTEGVSLVLDKLNHVGTIDDCNLPIRRHEEEIGNPESDQHHS